MSTLRCEVIRATLVEDDGEDLAIAMQKFDNMRDDGWMAFAGFSTKGPHVELLRVRIRNWITANLDEDEAVELLILIGMYDYDEDEKDDE